MRIDEQPAFIERVFAVASFYKEKTSDFMFEIWWAALKDYDYDAVTKAMTRYATSPDSGVFMPKPADIVRLLVGSSSDAAEIAWGKLYRAIGRVGRNSDVVFDDALIHAVVEDMGGWIKACEIDGDKEVSFMRVQFIKAYQAYRSRGALPEYPRALTGISNLHNAANGFRLARPIGVGDAEKVRLVFEGGGAGGSLKVFGLSDAVLSLSGKQSLMLE